MKVFCSYRSTDRATVEAFARSLRVRGLDAWFDRWEIEPGDDIVARMDSGVDGCQAALVFISEAWFDGTWAYDEYTSLALRKVEDGIRLIPVMIGGVPARRLPARMRKLARRSVEDFDAICDALLGVDHKPGLGDALRAAPVAVTLSITQGKDGRPLTTLSVAGRQDVSARAATDVLGFDLGAASTDAALGELGRRIGRVLFAGEVDEGLRALLDELGAGAVVDLRVCGGEELMWLPYEAARLSDGRAPVLLAPVRMSRAELGLEGVGAPPSAAGPLKILVAVGAPDEDQTRGAALDVEAEMGSILDAVGEAVADERAQVRILEVADPASIEQALRRDDYHVVHLSGHGGQGTIELADEEGRALAVSADDLVDAFQAAGKVVPLVFVSACQDGDSARGLAFALHRRGIARVVAMMASVSDRYAT